MYVSILNPVCSYEHISTIARDVLCERYSLNPENEIIDLRKGRNILEMSLEQP